MLGCSGGGSGTVAVQGLVRLDGQPLKSASVQFVPEDPAGRDAMATTDQEGRFVLSTFDARDGALPGSYKIVVTPIAPAQEASKPMTPDEAMAEASRTPPKPVLPGFPEKYTRVDQTPLRQTVPATGDIVIELQSK